LTAELDRGPHVDLPEPFEFFVEAPPRRLARQHIDTRVVYPDIDAAGPLPTAVDQRAALGRDGQIGHFHGRSTAAALDFVNENRGGVRVAVSVNDGTGAGRSQLPSDCAANAARGSRHDRRLTAQSTRGCLAHVLRLPRDTSPRLAPVRASLQQLYDDSPEG
jgi:hypothetical protein